MFICHGCMKTHRLPRADLSRSQSQCELGFYPGFGGQHITSPSCDDRGGWVAVVDRFGAAPKAQIETWNGALNDAYSVSLLRVGEQPQGHHTAPMPGDWFRLRGRDIVIVHVTPDWRNQFVFYAHRSNGRVSFLSVRAEAFSRPFRSLEGIEEAFERVVAIDIEDLWSPRAKHWMAIDQTPSRS